MKWADDLIVKHRSLGKIETKMWAFFTQTVIFSIQLNNKDSIILLWANLDGSLLTFLEISLNSLLIESIHDKLIIILVGSMLGVGIGYNQYYN